MNNNQRPTICGTDFSIPAAEAARVAAAIAKRVESEVVLIPVEEQAGLGASHPEVFSAVVDRTRAHLEVGSVAEHTAETSPVPTLVVRPPKR